MEDIHLANDECVYTLENVIARRITNQGTRGGQKDNFNNKDAAFHSIHPIDHFLFALLVSKLHGHVFACLFYVEFYRVSSKMSSKDPDSLCQFSRLSFWAPFLLESTTYYAWCTIIQTLCPCTDFLSYLIFLTNSAEIPPHDGLYPRNYSGKP